MIFKFKFNMFNLLYMKALQLDGGGTKIVY